MILLIDNYDSFSYNLFQLAGSIRPDIEVVRNDALTIPQIRSKNPDAIILSPGPGRPADAGICEEIVREIGRGLPVIPVLGVCLGHQAICEAYGASITYAARLMHGKQSGTILSGFAGSASGDAERADTVCTSVDSEGSGAACTSGEAERADAACASGEEERPGGKHTAGAEDLDHKICSSPLFEGLPPKITVARYHSLAVQEDTLPASLAVTARAEDGEVMAVQHKQYPVFGLQFHPESIMTPDGAVILQNFLSLAAPQDKDLPALRQ